MDIFRSILILVRGFFGNRFVLADENGRWHTSVPIPTLRKSCIDNEDRLSRGDSGFSVDCAQSSTAWGLLPTFGQTSDSGADARRVRMQ
jgi:hypothetical protein